MSDKGLHVAGLMQFSSTGINEYNTTKGGPAIEQIVSTPCSTPWQGGCTWQCRRSSFVYACKPTSCRLPASCN